MKLPENITSNHERLIINQALAAGYTNIKRSPAGWLGVHPTEGTVQRIPFTPIDRSIPWIEIGHEYVTVNGRKVRVYAVDGIKGEEVHGAWLSDSGWQNDVWAADGKSCDAPGFNITGPWLIKPAINWAQLPAWAKWAAMDEDGTWAWYDESPSLLSTMWANEGEFFGDIHPDYAPKWGGQWKDSLVSREESGQ